MLELQCVWVNVPMAQRGIPTCMQSSLRSFYPLCLLLRVQTREGETERERERVRVCVCCFASSRRACFRCRSFKVLHMHLRPAYSNGATGEVYPNHDCLPTTATPGDYPVHVAVAGPPCSRGLRQPPAQACSTLKLLLECPRHGNSSLHCRVSCSSPSLALLLMLPHGRNHCDGQRDDGLVIERTASTTHREVQNAY